MNDKYVEPITVGGTAIVMWGLTLSDWVAVLTMVYLGIHIILLIPRVISFFRKKNDK
ncbi:hypothetical protein [Taylorella equigenitalis]|uniref:hypothetical protein n=1 Tax=Taylorella equigenitalis TaxID=29575 RepID=UPI0004173AC6|nr:hypothetical protein [Taylorella equigenitalis]